MDIKDIKDYRSKELTAYVFGNIIDNHVYRRNMVVQ